MAQVTVSVLKNHDAQVGAFGSNGKAPQASSAVGIAAANAAGATPTQAEFNAAVALLNNIRTALINNGIAKQ